MRCSLLLLLSASFVHPLGIPYNNVRGRKALNIASAAYSSQPQRCLQVTYPVSGYRVLRHEEVSCDKEGNKCAGFVAVSDIDQQVIVGFRGTKTKAQLVLEAKEGLEPEIDWYGVGQVNRYFFDAVQPLWPMVAEVLADDSRRDYRVVFSGHSLGGAIAALMAMKSHLEGMRPGELLSLITFGEPRVGNRVFAHNLQAAIADSWRVVHNRDPIPHLPPCKDLGRGCDPFDYRRAFHHGREIWYPNDMLGEASFVACIDNFEDPLCSNSVADHLDVHDHARYFGVNVSHHGVIFCQERLGQPDQSLTTPLFSIFPLLLLVSTLFF